MPMCFRERRLLWAVRKITSWIMYDHLRDVANATLLAIKHLSMPLHRAKVDPEREERLYWYLCNNEKQTINESNQNEKKKALKLTQNQCTYMISTLTWSRMKKNDN